MRRNGIHHSYQAEEDSDEIHSLDFPVGFAE
jgi:hypothetical protein